MTELLLGAGPLRHDLSACFADRVGPAGLSRKTFQALAPGAADALAWLRGQRQSNALPLLNLAESDADIAVAAPVAARFRERFDNVAILGTGGSSLGGATICRLAAKGADYSPDAPRLNFLNNVDPSTFEAFFRRVDLKRTGFIAISKSGSTAETVCQTMVCLGALRAAGLPAEEHFLFVSEPGRNPMRVLAEKIGAACLDHDPHIGGRYSGLTVNGLLPAMIVGLDPHKVRRGAGAAVKAALDPVDPLESAAAVGAMVNLGLARERGVNVTVLMPYSDRLDRLGAWYTQLWAESLGKQGQGTTPHGALGAVDQHSQLQLFLAGPRDKLFTVVTTDVAGTGARVSPQATELMGEGIGYLAGRTMGDLLDAEQRATVETLVANGCPTRVIHAARVDEECLGALMMHLMLETMVAARLMGIDAFDQPAVEEGKVLARRYLSEMRG